MKKSNLFLIPVLMMNFVSCGKDSGKNSSISPEGTVVPMEAQNIEGKYDVILRPLNTPVSGFIPSGRTIIEVKEGSFVATSFLEDDARVQHIQSIHEGTRCPTIADDTNKDGFIDSVEMKRSTGNVLIPLDGDLNTQMAGQDFYPTGKAFTYQKSGDLKLMLQDLYTKDLPPNSNLAKLPSNTPMNLAGRVVIIHGTSDINRVPVTVKSMNGLPRNLTIPITCGVIKRITPN